MVQPFSDAQVEIRLPEIRRAGEQASGRAGEQASRRAGVPPAQSGEPDKEERAAHLERGRW